MPSIDCLAGTKLGSVSWHNFPFSLETSCRVTSNTEPKLNTHFTAVANFIITGYMPVRFVNLSVFTWWSLTLCLGRDEDCTAVHETTTLFCHGGCQIHSTIGGPLFYCSGKFICFNSSCHHTEQCSAARQTPAVSDDSTWWASHHAAYHAVFTLSTVSLSTFSCHFYADSLQQSRGTRHCSDSQTSPILKPKRKTIQRYSKSLLAC